MNKPLPVDPAISRLAQQGILMPQESLLEIKTSNQNLFIGIPKETSFQENRIALVPESVALLVNNGHQVMIETNAGKNANFTDTDYSEAGAQIAYTPEEVYKNAKLILKVAPPSEAELELVQEKQTLLSILQIAMQPRDFVSKLRTKKITALAYEYMRDETEVLPVIQAMSEIVGSTSILIAAEYLSNTMSGKGELLGGVTGIPPTEVVIIGAGTVGEYAAKTALGLGATVKVFDNNLYKLRRIQKNLGQQLYTSTIVPSFLMKALRTADVAIGAIHAKEGRTPVIVSEEMVSEMRFGSVIIDVSIDQGGCFETSEVTNHTHPVFRKYGVIHYCVPNIASRVARTASYALSNIFTPILINIGEEGGLDEFLWAHKTVRSGIYLYKGTVTNKFVSEHCRLPYRDLNLLMASRI
ncbi:MAG: alanine dehydrogenase [Bacteroidia bacterium]|jgi:alanine dehydrogenase|nr:alanine dehydrogenase [Bacteroidota bacterium]MBK9424693.1 alanine dehydrogenase [Bacteroidota bacterium]MBP9084434.1 alanine dehydrogenase [Bacteroidia bacterium]OQA11410.1 MAG: Alanine dehydrogenase [Bacteroidetes bacterium ADurb.Bin397]